MLIMLIVSQMKNDQIIAQGKKWLDRFLTIIIMIIIIHNNNNNFAVKCNHNLRKLQKKEYGMLIYYSNLFFL